MLIFKPVLTAPLPRRACPSNCWRTADLTTFIDGRFGLEGSGRATTADITVRINDTAPPADSDPDPPPLAPVANIVFNGLGRTTLAAPAIFKFNDPDGGARCVTDPGPPAGTVRCLRVVCLGRRHRTAVRSGGERSGRCGR